MLRFNKEIQGKRSSDDYTTPYSFYEKINNEFNFNFDPCPLRSKVDNLKNDWIGNVYVNPPYSNIKPFLEKALIELKNRNAKIIVFLIPVRSDTKYFHDIILKKASEIRFVKGRLNFNEMKSPAPFPVMLVIFEQKQKPLSISSY